MSVPFDPFVARLIGEGHAARTLLTAMEALTNALVEDALRELDRELANRRLTAEMAVTITHEIGAYRRILARLRARVVAGEKAEQRHAREQGEEEEQSA